MTLFQLYHVFLLIYEPVYISLIFIYISYFLFSVFQLLDSINFSIYIFLKYNHQLYYTVKSILKKAILDHANY